MYTRCPSCRAEISFEPPANAASLPDGYKHKIKCPSCGVTIGVKIPRLDSAIQPTFTPQNPYAVSPEPVFVEQPVSLVEIPAPAQEKKKPYGRAANIFALLFSAILALVLGLAYLVNTGKIDFELLDFLAVYDPITPILYFLEVGTAGLDIALVIVTLIPTITLGLAVVHAIVSIICCAVGTYSRVYNLLWGLLIFVGALASLLQSGFLLILAGATEAGVTPVQALLYSVMMYLFDENANLILLDTWPVFLVPFFGFASFLTALCSLGVRRKKAKVA